MNTLKHIVLIGVGLIGGSFVLDLKRLGLVDTVTGIDLDRDNLDRALERHVSCWPAMGTALKPVGQQALDHSPLNTSVPRRISLSSPSHTTTTHFHVSEDTRTCGWYHFRDLHPRPIPRYGR